VRGLLLPHGQDQGQGPAADPAAESGLETGRWTHCLDLIKIENMFFMLQRLITLSNLSLQRKLDDLVDKGYVHRSDITDHIMQALEGTQHCKHLLC
jgi:hypothetical protein